MVMHVQSPSCRQLAEQRLVRYELTLISEFDEAGNTGIEKHLEPRRSCAGVGRAGILARENALAGEPVAVGDGDGPGVLVAHFGFTPASLTRSPYPPIPINWL